MGDTDRLVLAKPSRTLRAMANRRESLSTLAQRGTLGSHLADLATTSRSCHFICLSLLSVAVVLEGKLVWYGMRSWIEGGFKDTKRGGWGWHQTKMVDPERAERLWLAIAVATLWAVSSLEVLPETHVARRKATRLSRPRMLSCFADGVITIIGRLIRDDGLVVGRFVPEPWPTKGLRFPKRRTPSPRLM